MLFWCSYSKLTEEEIKLDRYAKFRALGQFEEHLVPGGQWRETRASRAKVPLLMPPSCMPALFTLHAHYVLWQRDNLDLNAGTFMPARLCPQCALSHGCCTKLCEALQWIACMLVLSTSTSRTAHCLQDAQSPKNMSDLVSQPTWLMLVVKPECSSVTAYILLYFTQFWTLLS